MSYEKSLREDPVFDEQLNYAPGASDLHPRILRAMEHPHVTPWIDEFNPYLQETTSMLKQLFGTKNEIIVLMSMIRGIMDAVIASIVEPGDGIVIASSGYWSDWWIATVEAYGGTPILIQQQWGLPWTADKVRSELARKEQEVRGAKAFILTHVETSTGILNRAWEIGPLVKERGMLFILDSSQALGGEEVRVDEWGADFCTAGNHKCMSTPGGLAFVTVSREALGTMEKRTTPIRGWYSNLLLWRSMWAQAIPALTVSTSLLYALREALQMIFEITPQEIYPRYEIAAKAIRFGLSELGLRIVADGTQCPGCDAANRHCASTATAIWYPQGIDHTEFRRVLSRQYRIAIGGGLGKLAGKTFRVGPTGFTQIQPRNVLSLIQSIGLGLRQFGLDANIENAIRVTNEILGVS
jgi:alanine-glyoxylate transaminase/serine-glyoxylate transaminase/serine-pyruvate transaminase